MGEVEKRRRQGKREEEKWREGREGGEAWEACWKVPEGRTPVSQ